VTPSFTNSLNDKLITRMEIRSKLKESLFICEIQDSAVSGYQERCLLGNGAKMLNPYICSQILSFELFPKISKAPRRRKNQQTPQV